VIDDAGFHYGPNPTDDRAAKAGKDGNAELNDSPFDISSVEVMDAECAKEDRQQNKDDAVLSG
jgi:hypothetical protein